MTVYITCTILLYNDDIALMVRSFYDPDKQVKILKNFHFIIDMTANIGNKDYDNQIQKDHLC